MKHLRKFREQFRSRLAFTINDVKKVLSKNGITRDYLYVLIHNLIKKGEIKRIRNGVYTMAEDMMVVGFAFPPFYYGLQEALSLRKLWEQETNPVIITARKIRSGTRTFLGNNYVIKRIDRKMLFGYEMVRYYDSWIPVSDVEKTLIDFVYFKQRLPEETVEELRKNIRKDVMVSHLKRVPDWVKKRIVKILAKP